MTSATAAARSGFAALFERVSRAFLVSAALGRIPQAMMAVAVLTYMPSAGADYGTAGLAAGSVGIGSALGAPVFGRFVDRFGPRTVLLVFAVLHAAALVSFMLAAPRYLAAGGTAALVGLCLHAGLIGAACPQIGAVARVVWRNRLGSGPQMNTAMSFESTVDELSFVLGPVLVGLAASLVAPWLPLVLSAALVLTMVLLLMRSLPPVTAEPASTGTARLTVRTLLVIAACALGMVSMGTVFGGTLTALLPFAAGHGVPDATGLLYGGLSLTSALAALSVPLWAPRVPASARWILMGALLVGATLLLARTESLWGMVLVLALVGIPVGPSMVTIFETAGAVAPSSVLATVMTVLGSGIVAGTALASAVAGSLAETSGAAGAFLVPVIGGCGVLATGLAAALLRRSAPARPRA